MAAVLLALRHGVMIGSPRSRSDPQPLCAADGRQGQAGGPFGCMEERRGSVSRFAPPLPSATPSSCDMRSTDGGELAG